jgi:hypothetical protein
LAAAAAKDLGLVLDKTIKLEWHKVIAGDPTSLPDYAKLTASQPHCLFFTILATVSCLGAAVSWCACEAEAVQPRQQHT